MDYRLAVLFTVIVPLILLIWAFIQKIDAIQRLLVIYWRVSSLLAITVYLMIAAFPMSFITSILARILMIISLWFWVDLNEELEDMQSSILKFSFISWRWAVSIYSGLGALLFIPFLRCAFLDTKGLIADQTCRVWLDPPWMFKEIFHPGWTPGFLGFLGLSGLVFYLICFGYFIVVKLGRQGRSATGH
ncbi:DUF3177 family protein [Capilliphycus salinus ALCB114379]|uniref:DUF3177 family protein n=1 Tax=Capilliphycus salinus TaxID=2768948 RepID=UPI0039A67332